MDATLLANLAKAEALIQSGRRHLAVMDRQIIELTMAGAEATDLFAGLDRVRQELARWLDTAAAAAAAAVQGPALLAAQAPFATLLGPPEVRSATSRGKEVEALQRLLTHAGFKVSVDGHFNRQTQQALAAWQRRHGLKPDGVTGAGTRKLLNEWLATLQEPVLPLGVTQQ